jgi:hypothetical protein
MGAHGGQVTDTFHDGQRLFTRAVLPAVEEVQRGDKVQGGVALKAMDEGVWLYPYLFRLICKNGAIMAQALESRFLADLHQQDPDEAVRSVREGIGACCAPEVFIDIVGKVRSTCHTQANRALNMMPLLNSLPRGPNSAYLSTLLSQVFGGAELPRQPPRQNVVSQIMDRFFRDGDRSQFGLANAVTATARDTKDPELRWKLEEFGGGLAIGRVPKPPADSGCARKTRVEREVALA